MIKLLKKKLRSCCGAAMLMAMVFMLFCSFIGGTVLAAATANASRVASLAEQQQFMLERSAAMLLADQLRLGSNEEFRLHVMDAFHSRQEVELLNGGGFKYKNVPPEEERIVTFTMFTTDSYVTPLQRLMVETAILRYLQEYESEIETSVVLLNVYHQETNQGITKRINVGNVEGFWCQPTEEEMQQKIVGGMLQVVGESDENNIVDLPDYIANYSCGRGAEIYDFNIDFGEGSQLKLHMDSNCGRSIPTRVVSPPSEKPDDESKIFQITTESITTSISWDAPTIEKGGAA